MRNVYNMTDSEILCSDEWKDLYKVAKETIDLDMDLDTIILNPEEELCELAHAIEGTMCGRLYPGGWVSGREMFKDYIAYLDYEEDNEE